MNVRRKKKAVKKLAKNGVITHREWRYIFSWRRKRHKGKCPKCGNVFGATLSLAQMLGEFSIGRGRCKCGLAMNLCYDPRTNTMVVRPWDEYVADLIREDGCHEPKRNKVTP